MNRDISDALRDWEYEGQNTIRFFTSGDNRRVMQVRLPLGIEQYELEGRPDGLRPEGRDSYLDLVRQQLTEAQLTGGMFYLQPEQFRRLREEGVLYYYRYLILFQIGDYSRTVDDTEHNLEICDLAENFYGGEDLAELLQYRPYILRVNAVSRAMLNLEQRDRAAARRRLESALNSIKAMELVDSRVFEIEKRRAVQHLHSFLEQLEEENPSRREKLIQELHKAVEAEEYERAAFLRDRLRDISEE